MKPPTTCPACGQSVGGPNRFCTNCGADVQRPLVPSVAAVAPVEGARSSSWGGAGDQDAPVAVAGLSVFCHQCGAAYGGPDDQFCEQCGASPVPTGSDVVPEHRQYTGATLPRPVPEVWSPRRGVPRSAWVSLLIVSIVAIAGVVAWQVVGRVVFTPARAATAYLEALGRGDVSTVLSDSTLGAAPVPTGTGAVSLLSPGDISSMIAHSSAPYSDVKVVSSSTSGSTATVLVSYVSGGTTQHTTLTLTSAHGSSFAIYPKWTVVVTPAVVTVDPPSFTSTIEIGGVQVPVSGQGQQTGGQGQPIEALVFPSQSLTVGAAGNDVFNTTVQTVDASSGRAQVNLANPTIKPSVTQAVNQAVASSLQACIASTVLQPPNCPQSYDTSDSNPTGVKWAAVGSVPTSITVTYLGNDAFSVTGQQEMSGSYSYSNPVDPYAVSDPLAPPASGTDTIVPQDYSFDYDVTLQGGTWTAVPSNLYTPSPSPGSVG
jgi:hypothetical protein